MKKVQSEGHSSFLILHSSLLKISFHLATRVFLFQCLALVKLLFALSQSHNHLGQPLFIDIQTRGHDGESGRLRITFELAKLLTREQQFAVTTRGVIVVRAIEILCDMHVLHPQLTPHEVTKRIHQAGLAHADGLDFRACQDNAGRVGVDKFVVDFIITFLFSL